VVANLLQDCLSVVIMPPTAETLDFSSVHPRTISGTDDRPQRAGCGDVIKLPSSCKQFVITGCHQGGGVVVIKKQHVRYSFVIKGMLGTKSVSSPFRHAKPATLCADSARPAATD
jgi:hypothetical protein